MQMKIDYQKGANMKTRCYVDYLPTIVLTVLIIGLLAGSQLVVSASADDTATTEKPNRKLLISYDLRVSLDSDEKIRRGFISSISDINDESAQVLRVLLLINETTGSLRTDILNTLYQYEGGDKQLLTMGLEALTRRLFDGRELQTRLAEIGTAKVKAPQSATLPLHRLECSGLAELSLPLLFEQCKPLEKEAVYIAFSRSSADPILRGLLWKLESDPEYRKCLILQIRNEEDGKSSQWKGFLNSLLLNMNSEQKKVHENEIRLLWDERSPFPVSHFQAKEAKKDGILMSFDLPSSDIVMRSISFEGGRLQLDNGKEISTDRVSIAGKSVTQATVGLNFPIETLTPEVKTATLKVALNLVHQRYEINLPLVRHANNNWNIQSSETLPIK